MLIKNLTKNRTLAKNAAFCGGIFSKFIGLMFSKKQKKSLIFKFNKEIIIHLHMFFVFYPIDALFLDKNKIVVGIKENFKPFTLYTSRKKAMYVIELLNGTTKRTKTEIGDKIEIWNNKKGMDC